MRCSLDSARVCTESTWTDTNTMALMRRSGVLECGGSALVRASARWIARPRFDGKESATELRGGSRLNSDFRFIRGQR
jgi:hypothetical protein